MKNNFKKNIQIKNKYNYNKINNSKIVKNFYNFLIFKNTIN